MSDEVDTILATVEQEVGPKADDYRERWDPRQRFRLYFVENGSTPDDRVEVAATETWDGIGTMLRLMTKEAELVGGRSAILDTALWATGRPGVWVVGSLA
jgi:hypothetical protein